MENTIHPAAYELAARQRYKALENAFDTIRQFAEPSCDPETFEKFEDVEKYLKEMYSKHIVKS